MLFSIIFTILMLTTSSHLYLTFASPAVYKRDVPADQSLNVTHLLAKRAYYPPDQLCGDPDDWVSRLCIYPVSDRLWWDICLGLTANGTPYIYIMVGVCNIDQMCFDMIVDSQDPEQPLPVPTSVCADRPQKGAVRTIFPDGITAQTGVVAVAGSVSLEHTISIPVLSGMSRASVSAFIEATGTNYAITPSANIFGSLGGATSLDLSSCNWNSTNLVCAPPGLISIPAFATLVFTFTLLSQDNGNLFYSVISS